MYIVDTVIIDRSFIPHRLHYVVECDEIEESNNVSYVGDDFTIETALEDLEFGFIVIKNTQKVRELSIPT